MVKNKTSVKEPIVESVLEDDEDELINFTDDEVNSTENDVSDENSISDVQGDKGKYNFGEHSDDSDDESEEDNSEDEASSNEEQDDEEMIDEEDPKEVRKKAREASKVNLEKAKRTVFVGNLTSRVTRKILIQLFESKEAAGPRSVESIRIRGGPGDHKHEKKIAIINKKFKVENQVLCAFVVLKEEEYVTKCLNINNHLVDGRHIRVDTLKGKKMTYEPSQCVFLGNLPYSVDEEEVRTEFSKCGDLVNIRLVRDKSTGKVKGFGYVEYKDKESAMSALKLSNVVKIGGRAIRVEKWTKSNTQENVRKNQNGKRKKADGNQDKDAPKNKVRKVVLPTNIKNLDPKEYIKQKQIKNAKRQTKKKNFVNVKRNVKSKTK